MKNPFTEFGLQAHPLEAQNLPSCFPLKINLISRKNLKVKKMTFSDWNWVVQQVNK